MPQFPILAATAGRARSHRKCTDCQHCVVTKELFILDVHMCAEPSVTDEVTGQPVVRARDMRHRLAPCGPRGKLFAAAPVFERAVPAPRLITVSRISELFGQSILEARRPEPGSVLTDDEFEVLVGERAA